MLTTPTVPPLCQLDLAPTAGPVLAIIGPSGGGKSTVVRELARRGIVRVHPTWTTRPRRFDERDGSVEHRFVSEERFERLCADGFFLETARLSGLPYRYGLPPLQRSRHGPLDCVMLRAPFVARFARHVPSCLVYQITDTPERVIQRLVGRHGQPADLAARVEDNRREVAAGRAVASRVFANDGSVAVLADAMATAILVDRSQATARNRRVGQ